MRLKFFTVPVFGDRQVADELDRFLAAHRIMAIDKELIHDGRGSAWSLCVSYDHAGEPRSAEKRAKVDYKEVLSETEFPLYARLRGHCMSCSIVRVDRGRTAGAKRVVRGGSWNNKARNCRCACRNQNDPGNRNNDLGFRPARAHDRTGWSEPEQTALPAIPVGLAKPNGPRCVGSPRWIPGEGSPVGRLLSDSRPSIGRLPPGRPRA